MVSVLFKFVLSMYMSAFENAALQILCQFYLYVSNTESTYMRILLTVLGEVMSLLFPILGKA